MNEYFIRGTISVEFREGDCKVRISPTTGFTSPETESKAIAFPISPSGKMNGNQAIPDPVHMKTAKLLDMTEKKYEVSIKGAKIAMCLGAIAGQQKIVELRLTVNNKAKEGQVDGQKEGQVDELMIVGFIFPAL